MPSNYSNRFQLESGKWVYTQSSTQKNDGQSLVGWIKKKWQPPQYYYHFQKGGHIAALKTHRHNNIFASADIHCFYDSVTRSKIIRSLKKIRFKYNDALYFATESTVKNNDTRSLPFGFVQSPLLATLVLAHTTLGESINYIYKSKNVTISVYMDDIVISSNNMDDIHKAFNLLIDSAQKSNFILNELKLSKPTDTIKAFNINLDSNQLEITEARLKDFATHVQLHGKSPSSLAVINYVKMVNKEQASLLTSLLS